MASDEGQEQVANVIRELKPALAQKCIQVG
mgnify:CR=1 FL=1